MTDKLYIHPITTVSGPQAVEGDAVRLAGGMVYAREFDRRFPGFETDIHGLRFEDTGTGRRYLVDCLTEGDGK